MSKTKDLWEEWRQQELDYLRNKRLSLYRWYGEFSNKELNNSGWDEDFTSPKQDILYSMKKPKRIIQEINGEMLYQCMTCEELKPTYDFMTNRKVIDEVHYHCRECVSSKKQKNRNDTRIDDYQIESVKNQVIQFFKNMGYDMDRPISEQFIRKIKEKYGVDLS